MGGSVSAFGYMWGGIFYIYWLYWSWETGSKRAGPQLHWPWQSMVPVGDEFSRHCFLIALWLSVFSPVQFAHYLQMGVYLGKAALWVSMWKSPGQKHVPFSLEGGMRINLGRWVNIFFPCCCLCHMAFGHMEGRVALLSITVARTGISLCVCVETWSLCRLGFMGLLRGLSK